MSDFVKLTDGTDKRCLTNGVTIIAGGAGINDMTIGAPSPGHRAVIRLASITGENSVVVKTDPGITFDGANNTATFNAAEDVITLVYNTPTAWAVESNVSVGLSNT